MHLPGLARPARGGVYIWLSTTGIMKTKQLTKGFQRQRWALASFDPRTPFQRLGTPRMLMVSVITDTSNAGHINIVIELYTAITTCC